MIGYDGIFDVLKKAYQLWRFFDYVGALGIEKDFVGFVSQFFAGFSASGVIGITPVII